MKKEDWDGVADDDVESFDSSDESNELETDEQNDASLSTKKQKPGVTGLRRRIEDRLESRRLREAFEFDDDFDEPLGRLG
mgnify:CR=1 FL=1|jgi:hypothetical protein